MKKINPFKRGGTWTYLYYTHDPVTHERKQHKKGGFATREDALLSMNKTLGKIATDTCSEEVVYE